MINVQVFAHFKRIKVPELHDQSSAQTRQRGTRIQEAGGDAVLKDSSVDRLIQADASLGAS